MQLLIAYVFLILSGLVFQKSKIVFYSSMLVNLVITGLNNGGMDFVEYELMFETYGKSPGLYIGPELIYRNIISLFYKLGFDFITMNFVVTVISIVVIIKFIKKYTKREALVSSLLMIYPMFDMAIQKRNFFAMAILLLAIDRLITKRKNYRIKSLFFILISAGIHTTFLVYIPIIFIHDISIEKIKKIIYVTVILEILLLTRIPNILAALFPNEKIGLYFISSRISLEGAIGFILAHLVLFLFVQRAFSTKTEYSALYKISVGLNFLCLLVIPLYFYNSNFIRVVRNIMIIFYVAISELVFNGNKKSVQRGPTMSLITLVSFFIVTAFGVIFYIIVDVNGFKGLVMPLFEQNLLFSQMI